MKAVIFDLDDTLLRDDLSISPFTVQVMRRLREEGVHVVAASGRSRVSMKPFLDTLGCVSLSISCNGAEIWAGASDELLRQELFSPEVAREIAAFGEEHRCHVQVYGGGYFYYNHPGPFADRYSAASRLTGVCVGDLGAFIREPRNKVMIIAEPETVASLRPQAIALLGDKASITCSKPCYLEFNPPEATKGKALLYVAQRLSLAPEDFIAFGDSLNDLSMLQAAGRAVCVANAWKEIQPLCDEVCLSNQEDGVARYLNDHYLRCPVIPS